MWLNKTFKITKNAIRVVTSLCSSKEMSSLKSVKNQIITNATRSRFNKRAMIMNNIFEHDVRFSSMVIGYKIYYSNKHNSISRMTIYASYEMIREYKKYELCEFIWSELIKN